MTLRPGATERAVRRYRRLLTLYPRAYRDVASEELCQVFREAYADERQRRGARGTTALWLRVGLDVARTAPGAWRAG